MRRPVDYCPHIPGLGQSINGARQAWDFATIMRAGLANYRLGLILPPALLFVALYLTEWGWSMIYYFGNFNLGWPEQVAFLLQFPYFLLLIGMPVSFICILAQISLTRNVILYGRYRAVGLISSMKELLPSALPLTILYLSAVTLVKYAYAVTLAQPLETAAYNSLPIEFAVFFAATSKVGVAWYAQTMPDLYSMGAYSGLDIIGAILLVAPLHVFYWLTLTAASFDGIDALGSIKLASIAFAKRWKSTIAYSLVVALYLGILEGLPASPLSQMLLSNLLWYGHEAMRQGATVFRLSLYSAKVLITPLFFVWIALIYTRGKAPNA